MKKLIFCKMLWPLMISGLPLPALAQPVATHTIGGSVSGLTAGQSLVLRNRANDDLWTVGDNGTFVFTQRVLPGSNYNVRVESQPGGQACSVAGGMGVNVQSDINSIQINCLTVQADNCAASSINARGNYILGDVGGTPSAMHWPTGLVWKRCSEGQGWDDSAQQCTGSEARQDWGVWGGTDARLPLAFEGQENWRVNNLPSDHNLLAGGGWRMAYRSELLGITEGCGALPTLNRDVFSGEQPAPALWSASPYLPLQDNVWFVNFQQGFTDQYDGIGMGTRLVRGGQPFAAVPAQAQFVLPGQVAPAELPAFTLAANAPGQAWGGARIAGEGNPEFRVGSGPWVTEAIVASGDVITVRLTAPPAIGVSHSATLVLRSGLTSGTLANAANGGDESTAMQEIGPVFTLVGAVPRAPGSVQPVPALSPWMLLLLSPLMGLLGWRRRQQ